MTNCPNCGAVITGPKCEYCGTVFGWQPDTKPYVLENDLLAAKTKALADAEEIKILYMEALKAMRNYANSY